MWVRPPLALLPQPHLPSPGSALEWLAQSALKVQGNVLSGILAPGRIRKQHRGEETGGCQSAVVFQLFMGGLSLQLRSADASACACTLYLDGDNNKQSREVRDLQVFLRL